MFESAYVVAQEYHSKYDDLAYQLRIACTRSFVVDYLKPWSGNYSQQINSLKQNLSGNKWHYPFLDQVINTNEHEEFIELRNKIVAHLDQDYEGGGISLKGTVIKNKPINRAKDEGTLDQVFLPALTVLTGNRGLWWLSNKDKISEFVEHIKRTKNIV
jgi:hypothetical protein